MKFSVFPVLILAAGVVSCAPSANRAGAIDRIDPVVEPRQFDGPLGTNSDTPPSTTIPTTRDVGD